MFCKNCGNKLDGTKKFCTNCGTPSPVQPAEKVSEPKEPWTPRRIAKYVIVVVVVGGLIAAKLIFAAISSVENDVVETNDQGLASFDAGNTDQAIAQFREASEGAITTANKVNALVNLAYVYATESRNAESLATFKEALALAEPDSYAYYLISGEIAYLENRPSEALGNYQKAYSLKPNEFQVNNALALFYMDTEDRYPAYVDYPKALTYALKADEVSELELVRENLALAYILNEKYSEAISVLNSISINKDTTNAYFLGLCYLNLGDEANAKFYLRKAINAGVDVPQEIYDYVYAY